jgi:hypothetical protein
VSKNSTTRFITNLFVLVVSVALVGADLVVLAQNENDTTRGGTMTSQNGNTNTSTGTSRRRRQRRRAAANANTSGDVSANVSGSAGDTTMSAGAGMQANTNTGGTGRRRRRGRRRATTDMSGGAAATTTTMGTTTGVADNTGGEQTDLSGTYTGNVNYPEGGLSGAATLTITGNSFTITPEGGGSAVTGRVTAVTTRKYTGVTMMFGNPTAPPPTQNPPPPPLPAVSLQAKRVGDTVTLMSVPGEKRQFSFSSAPAAGTGGTGRRRSRRRARRSSGMGNMAHSIRTL